MIRFLSIDNGSGKEEHRMKLNNYLQNHGGKERLTWKEETAGPQSGVSWTMIAYSEFMEGCPFHLAQRCQLMGSSTEEEPRHLRARQRRLPASKPTRL